LRASSDTAKFLPRWGRNLLAALTLLATPALAAPADPAVVAAAERAFAADGLKHGIKASFLSHSAADAIVFQPDPVSAQATYKAAPDDAAGPPLVWWPLKAGIARSGDLGFTTGPFTYDGKPGGYYFTVWKKQADASWKWIFDGGPPSDMTTAAPQGSPPAYLPVSTTKGKYPEAAYLKVLSPDARVAGSRAAPVDSPAGQAAELATRAAQISFSPLGGEASKAADLAWTYGDAAWTTDGKPARGHYVRIWQLRKTGWTLVYDAILKAPPKS
jgi:ketosteroid isomerase-like protein